MKEKDLLKKYLEDCPDDKAFMELEEDGKGIDEKEEAEG